MLSHKTSEHHSFETYCLEIVKDRYELDDDTGPDVSKMSGSGSLQREEIGIGGDEGRDSDNEILERFNDSDDHSAGSFSEGIVEEPIIESQNENIVQSKFIRVKRSSVRPDNTYARVSLYKKGPEGFPVCHNELFVPRPKLLKKDGYQKMLPMQDFLFLSDDNRHLFYF